MLKMGIIQVLSVMVIGACFASIPVFADSAGCIIAPDSGTFGTDVVITVVSSTDDYSQAEELVFFNEYGTHLRVPITVVSRTTVYTPISLSKLEPGEYMLALNLGGGKVIFLDKTFTVIPQEKKPLIEVIILETLKPTPQPTPEPTIDPTPDITPEIAQQPITNPTIEIALTPVQTTTVETPQPTPEPASTPAPEPLPPSYTITAQAKYGGNIEPSGSVVVRRESSQSFVITPDFGYIIADLTIDGEQLAPASSYTYDAITADHSITAHFTVEIPDAPAGKVNVITDADEHTQISPSGSLFVDEGTSLTFTMKASPGSEYTTLIVNGEERAPEKMIRITADKNYVIQSRGQHGTIKTETRENELKETKDLIVPMELEQDITYTILARADIGGSIEPADEVSVAAGSDQAFKIIPNTGYRVKAVLIDGIGIGGTTEYLFTSVQESHNIRVLFERG